MKAVTRPINKRANIDASEMELEEKLLAINRVTKVVKGGKRLHFRALVVVGDGKGHVGIGLAKAVGVPEAVRKANAAARKELIEVPIVNTTIPHEILAKFGASKILLKPAAFGSGIIASNAVRAVVELAGIKDILGKSLGSSNRVNVVKATMLALASLRKPKESVIEDKTDSEAQKDEVNETE
ncbi:MAG TPA: 30S ribosomal protein S5 [Dehalococcoidia bacterium]|nr:30S ribosomal protein S5 [Dehalococcoidia bacterium]